MAEVMAKAEKMFTPIDGYGDIRLLEPKFVKKLHKILVKERFTPLSTPLNYLSMDRILDV